MISSDFLRPEWPAPDNVDAFFTVRSGGFSEPPYNTLNLAGHVSDNDETVSRNRALLDFASEPFWLNQVHSNFCVDADESFEGAPEGDAAVTTTRNRVLAIMVADCLPVFFCSSEGDRVGVAHAGWRGLANGVLESTVRSLGEKPLLAWLGPAIGPCHYEVGQDVIDAFPDDTGFVANDKGRYQMDLYAIARKQLQSLGVSCYGGGFCTFCDGERFFSYRRDGTTGRMGGFIFIKDR